VRIDFTAIPIVIGTLYYWNMASSKAQSLSSLQTAFR